MSAEPQELVPRDAATLVLLREGDPGVEVLLLSRPQSASFAAGAQVFPGGSVDPGDLSPGWAAATGALSPDPDLALRVAALRECYEECGVLLASRSDGGPLGVALARMEETRQQLRQGQTADFPAALERAGLRLGLDSLVACAHWVTPVGMHRRFDTRFYVARLPEGQQPRADPLKEHDAWRWVRPGAALAEAARGECLLLPPTRAVLQQFSESTSVEGALEAARSRPVVRVEPRLEEITQERYPGLDLGAVLPGPAAEQR